MLFIKRKNKMSIPLAKKLDCWALTNVGCQRENNEDFIEFVLTRKPLQGNQILAVVSDGMGGHAAGELASQLAVTTLISAFQPVEQPQISDLEKACQKANTTVWTKSLEKQEYRGMGCTCSALVLQGQEGYFAHIGDSRIYHLRNQELKQLTFDHTVANELRGQSNNMAPVNRHVLSRALGIAQNVQFETGRTDLLQSNDQFLLCSDGLYDHLSDPELAELLKIRPAKLATENMIALARHRGGNDNISALVINLNH